MKNANEVEFVAQAMSSRDYYTEVDLDRAGKAVAATREYRRRHLLASAYAYFVRNHGCKSHLGSGDCEGCEIEFEKLVEAITGAPPHG